ncbi:MAG: DUF3737 family protein [Bacteroidota bacterium]|nr:DUF3737 family protein [Bacteroidota bacterium]
MENLETISKNAKLISNTSFEGERPLFATNDIRLENVKFFPGESAIKESNHVEAYNCEFQSKYPFWHNDNVLIDDCLFTEGSRAAIWYSKNIRMFNTRVEAPKMFRELNGLFLENVKLPNAAECCWNCHNLGLYNVEVNGGDYIFMNNTDIKIDGFKLQGNYSFQYDKNVEIHHAEINSKDAFWNTENVTIFDSVINGEYLGWHSKNLRLVNCKISGTQPLCYATDLIMENCTLSNDSDLCFEYSTLQAQINGPIVSLKNPKGGSITAKSVGEIIINENCKNPGACQIHVENN